MGAKNKVNSHSGPVKATEQTPSPLKTMRCGLKGLEKVGKWILAEVVTLFPRPRKNFHPQILSEICDVELSSVIDTPIRSLYCFGAWLNVMVLTIS